MPRSEELGIHRLHGCVRWSYLSDRKVEIEVQDGGGRDEVWEGKERDGGVRS